MNRFVPLALVPNGLSLTRLVLGLAFPIIPAELRIWAVVIAALTDALDGLSARCLHVESNTGRLLDPLADKIFVLMLVGTLLAEGSLHPLWALGIAVRDLVVLSGVFVVALRGRWKAYRGMRPTWIGKTTTAIQFAVLLAAVLWGEAPLWLLTTTTLISTAAGYRYAIDFINSWSTFKKAQ